MINPIGINGYKIEEIICSVFGARNGTVSGFCGILWIYI